MFNMGKVSAKALYESLHLRFFLPCRNGLWWFRLCILSFLVLNYSGAKNRPKTVFSYY